MMKLLRCFMLCGAVGIMLATAVSCSLKKNTAATRNYTAFITRYNIYFNGDEHYKQTLKEMESKYADDYTSLVLMHPAEARTNDKAPQPQGDFKRSIEKAQKAIQLRSIKRRPARKPGKGNDPKYKAWLKRDEYNPFLHNAWMMMGRSQYMNGDFLGAASTFFYVSKHFTWLPITVTEAKLWQARSYCAVDWLFEAESILSRIKEKELANTTLQGLYDFSYADYYVRSHQYDKAIPYLNKAIKAAKGAQMVRLTFLLGQLYHLQGDKAAAYAAFKRVGSASNADYRTKFNARIKRSEVFSGDDIAPEVKSLRSLTRMGSNREYLDQIYYAIGNLYLSRADTANAISNYQLAVTKSTRSGIDKALAQIALGKLYFAGGRYDEAQPCYSEAVPQLPDNYPEVERLRRESDVLDELAVFSQNVHLQDSLLRLSYLSPDKQREVVDDIIKRLKERERKEAEDAKREEYLAQQAAQGTGLNQTGAASAASTFVMNTDNSWYFYNTATRNAGRTEFQKRWGSRRLEDDWRRRNKATFSVFDDVDADASEEVVDSLSTNGDAGDDNSAVGADAEARLHLTDPHYPDYYLSQIPSTDEERAIANDVIQDGLFNMAVILKDKLGNFSQAEREFNNLMTRYPDNSYRLEVYNNLFLMYLRQENMFMAEKYRHDILSQFPDSKFAEALRGDDYIDRLLHADSIQAKLYDRAYEAYMANKNALVHSIYTTVRTDYPLSRLMPKFMFINALAYVTERQPDKFAEQLRELLERYPDVDVAPLASDYLNYLNQGRQLNSSSSNLRGMIWSTRLTGDSSAVSMADSPAQFKLDSVDVPHYFVLLYPTALVNANALLYDVARFNFNTFTVRDFDLEQLTFGQLGIIVVKGFHSVADLSRYRTMMEQSATLKLPSTVIPVVISEENFNILVSQGRSFEEYFDAVGDERLRKTHTDVLPADEYPSAEEMYGEERERATASGVATTQTDESTDPDDGLNTPAASDPAVEEPFDVPIPEAPKIPLPKSALPQIPAVKKPAVPKPAVKPEKSRPKPVPPPPTRSEPDYPEGSEGDDPLLD